MKKPEMDFASALTAFVLDRLLAHSTASDRMGRGMTRQSKPDHDFLAIDQADDAWFEANPDRNYRLRRAHDSEVRSATRHAGPPASEISYVIIGQVPGFGPVPKRQHRRIVRFACEMIDTEELARKLFDEFIGAYERPRAYVRLPKPKPPAIYLAYDRGDQA
jgi:hypothetical protein